MDVLKKKEKKKEEMTRESNDGEAGDGYWILDTRYFPVVTFCGALRQESLFSSPLLLLG